MGEKPTPYDLSGSKFGRWTVIGRGPGNGRGARWVCRCTCGTERYVDSSNLRRGTSQSCGCLPGELGLAAAQAKRGDVPAPDPVVEAALATGGSSCKDICEATGLSRATVEKALLRLLASGRAQVRSGRRQSPRAGRSFVNLYSRAQG